MLCTGLIMPDGQINWSCPCLGGMATGPCGFDFREAFSCFHHSETELKGSDCYDQFAKMQECMTKYPELYDDDKDDRKDNIAAAADFDDDDDKEDQKDNTAAAGELNDGQDKTTNSDESVTSEKTS